MRQGSKKTLPLSKKFTRATPKILDILRQPVTTGEWDETYIAWILSPTISSFDVSGAGYWYRQNIGKNRTRACLICLIRLPKSSTARKNSRIRQADRNTKLYQAGVSGKILLYINSSKKCDLGRAKVPTKLLNSLLQKEKWEWSREVLNGQGQ